ncbi:alkaline phosphatase family protein [Streptomyces sp. RB6PN25]|uniref:phospholipase C n=1 Tax=Streptomyces humicola TaxID=2953240 RepID=A0ABT1Q1F5_9ACTN|nr:alkaline phosphatase family protein [Streptomyces humicola]MCQ4083736.1 alkaline phosphatase family protein [Streptomyces humicola]
MVGRGISAGARRRAMRWGALAGAVALAAASGTVSAAAASAPAYHGAPTATPVKHLVVIYDENVSFDHYFATYPQAANTDGTPFTPAKNTPKVNNLASAGLLKQNPNQYTPSRLSSSQAMTCDQNHNYSPEQYAYDGGKADQFVQDTETSKCSGNLYGEPGLSMDYYDGNTVTGLWNYAQHYAMSDNSFASGYGPSTPGALELVSGQTHGVISVDPSSGTENPKQTATPDPYTVASPNAKGVGTVIDDPDPAFDDCADSDHTSKNALAELSGKNIGDLLNAKGVTWGWFQGGFAPSTPWNGKQGSYAQCKGDTHTNVGGAAVEDYSPHHDPFEYYKSTANPHHLLPKSINEIGHNGQANHQYDLSAFDAVVKAGKLPAVSFLKAAEYQDGHAGYSDPTDEQHFLVKEINEIQQSPQWKDTAVVVAYDDSDGWYDHAYAQPLNGSKDSTKASDGNATDSPACQAGPAPIGGYEDRCGPGPRLPLLVISPYSKVNSVDHAPVEQASITRFIENNWRTGSIGDASFDRRAGSLNGLFDFGRPHDQQVLMNSNGSVASVKPIPTAQMTAADNSDTNAPSTDDLATQQLAETGSSFPALPVGLGAGAVVVVGAGLAYTVHRRRSVA